MCRMFLSLTFVLLLLAIPAMATGEVIFEMDDPTGDALGDGNYTYPLLEELGDKPGEMFDLTNFKVVDLGQEVELRLSFALEPNYANPFGGEGFNFHRIDIYLITGEGGSKETFRNGANVRFYAPWNKVIRIIDWNQSRVFSYQDNPSDPNAGTGIGDGFNVELKEKDIVVTVSKNIIGELDQNTQYYVLVGILDGLGKDQYLSVESNATKYVGGGGEDSDVNPNLYDILAQTPESQFKQLGAWRNGEDVVLHPVGGTSRGRTFKLVIISTVVLLIIGSVIFYLKRK